MFPFRSFVHNSSLDNSNHVLRAWKVEKKKKQCIKVRNIEKTKQEKKSQNKNSSCQFFVFTFLSLCPVQIPLLLNSFFKILIYVSCCPWSEMCMILAFLPTRLLISLFPVIHFEIPITRAFFDFPRGLELSGVDCTWLNRRAGKMKRALFSHWLPERVRQAHLTPSGFPALVPQEQVIFLGIW